MNSNFKPNLNSNKEEEKQNRKRKEESPQPAWPARPASQPSLRTAAPGLASRPKRATHARAPFCFACCRCQPDPTCQPLLPGGPTTSIDGSTVSSPNGYSEPPISTYSQEPTCPTDTYGLFNGEDFSNNPNSFLASP